MIEDGKIYPVQELAEQFAANTLQNFRAKLWLNSLYKAGVLTEGHEGYLPYRSSLPSEPSISSLKPDELLDHVQMCYDACGVGQEEAAAPAKEEVKAPTRTAPPAAAKESKRTEPVPPPTGRAKPAPAGPPPGTASPDADALIKKFGDEFEARFGDRLNADTLVEAVDGVIARHVGPVAERLESVHYHAHGAHEAAVQIREALPTLAEVLTADPEFVTHLKTQLARPLDEIIKEQKAPTRQAPATPAAPAAPTTGRRRQGPSS